MISRKKTRQVHVGPVPIGGDAPISIQSMTSTYTHDVDATVREIRRLAEAGCDIVRVAVPDRKDTEALRAILDQSPVPIIADVHFHFERALEAIAAGVHKIRLNPGNIKDRGQQSLCARFGHQVAQTASRCCQLGAVPRCLDR